MNKIILWQYNGQQLTLEHLGHWFEKLYIIICAHFSVIRQESKCAAHERLYIDLSWVIITVA